MEYGIRCHQHLLQLPESEPGCYFIAICQSRGASAQQLFISRIHQDVACSLYSPLYILGLLTHCTVHCTRSLRMLIGTTLSRMRIPTLELFVPAPDARLISSFWIGKKWIAHNTLNPDGWYLIWTFLLTINHYFRYNLHQKCKKFTQCTALF